MSAALLADTIRQLAEGGPRSYSRWSDPSWRLLCEGPAVRLWDAIQGQPGGDAVLVDYLYLLREAVGLQYVSAATPEDLARSIEDGFLAAAFCDVLPRLLPALPPEARGPVLAQAWNAGEKLASRPAWLNRYLAVRIRELTSLADFEASLAAAVREGLDPVHPSSWAGPFAPSAVDPSRYDRTFLPGRMHMATPAIACIHDVRRADRQVALLLRPGAPLLLGATPCLGEEGAGPATEISAEVREAARRAAGVEEITGSLAAAGGFVVFAAALSQRLWIAESAA